MYVSFEVKSTLTNDNDSNNKIRTIIITTIIVK